MRWGSVDYKQLQKLRDNLQKLQEIDLDKFCEDVSKGLAARLLQLVIPVTPVGQYPKSTGKKAAPCAGAGQLKPSRRPLVVAVTAETRWRPTPMLCQFSRGGGPFILRSSTLSTMPAMWSLDIELPEEKAGWRDSIF